MGRFFRMALAGGAALLALSDWGFAQTQWRVATPFQDNPLKVAVLTGEGTVSGNTFPVSLEFSCHPAAGVPRVVLRVPSMVADWDFHAYDSAATNMAPRRRFLTVMASNRRVLDRPRFTGIDGENASFMFSWQPNEALLSRLARQNDGALIVLDGLRRGQGNLEARFVFPADVSVMRDVLAPCSDAVAGQKKVASDAE
ncbi:hypothetical protein [Paludibacterium purpuratum]|uniref:Uncharacterized protein n=1 Tax=Paludibacterium purpuratum TaxID=1144873 RepID=A0A4R7B6B5_9NEIS|nr:hypothetical protein [Paludibacterium purpuratum]TDR80191.1 hypothetical protein DFP86_10545 [Paludibacterium purpuratum]